MLGERSGTFRDSVQPLLEVRAGRQLEAGLGGGAPPLHLLDAQAQGEQGGQEEARGGHLHSFFVDAQLTVLTDGHRPTDLWPNLLIGNRYNLTQKPGKQSNQRLKAHLGTKKQNKKCHKINQTDK